MIFKKIFRKIIPDNIIFYLKKKTLLKKKFFGLNNIDQKLLQYLDYNNGYFIELGANDGVTQSNTLHYEIYKNWNGILIEPIKSKFDQCKAIRKNSNKFFNCACVSRNYKQEDIKLIYSNLRSITLDENNLINPKNHVNNEDLNFFQRHNEFKVKVKSLNSILEESKAPNLIDFFSLDTEGYEMEILKGVDFNQYNFKYLLIESKKIEILKSYLVPKKYRLIDQLSKQDYLFRFNDY